MVDNSLPLYQHPQQTWNASKCKRLANRTARDGLGTKHHYKGHIYAGELGFIGGVRYNGGCVINGRWYQGEEHKLPILAKGFKFVIVPTWGYRIVKV
jgi:hypothetical protein